MSELPRLTRKILEEALAGKTQAVAWYDLATRGYLPDEIAMHSDGSHVTADVGTRVRRWAEANNLPIPATCAPKREVVRRKPPPADWRETFRQYTCRTGFVLALTQPMLEFLCAVADDVPSDRQLYFQQAGGVRPDNFITTGFALVKRGLISDRFSEAGKRKGYELTPAGVKLVDLLKLTGIFVEADAAIEKRTGGKRKAGG